MKMVLVLMNKTVARVRLGEVQELYLLGFSQEELCPKQCVGMDMVSDS